MYLAFVACQHFAEGYAGPQEKQRCCLGLPTERVSCYLGLPTERVSRVAEGLRLRLRSRTSEGICDG